MEWIDVKDRLPEFEEEVLILTKNISIYNSRLVEDCYKEKHFEGWQKDSITHWMPLQSKNEKELFEIIVKLWSIIDDIDTYGDMAKSDDKLYRSLVERKQRTRFETGITSDGYSLFYKGIKIDSNNNQETMRFNYL